MSVRPRRWNHNLQYHPVILGAVPAGCRRALDVGCGDGMLAREPRQVVPDVTGIDRSHRVHTLSKPCWRYSLVWIKPA